MTSFLSLSLSLSLSILLSLGSFYIQLVFLHSIGLSKFIFLENQTSMSGVCDNCGNVDDVNVYRFDFAFCGRCWARRQIELLCDWCELDIVTHRAHDDDVSWICIKCHILK